MKTIKQIAVELNTTPQNIYNHLKRNNISRTLLTSKKQGKQVFYDEEAERTIKGLFQEPVKQEKQNNGNDELFEALNAENKRLKEELERTKQAEEEARAEVARLRIVEEELRHQVSGLIDTNRGLTILQTKRIAEAADERVGLVGRIRLLLKGKKNNDE